MTVIKNPAASGKHIAEVSCKTNSGVIHCEEAAESMYASIDLLADKLARQVKKMKDKNLSSDKSSIRTDAADIDLSDGGEEVAVIEE